MCTSTQNFAQAKGILTLKQCLRLFTRGLTTSEDHCKKENRSRVEAVLMNIRNRNKTETERARAKAVSGRRVEINKSDGVKVTDAKVTV